MNVYRIYRTSKGRFGVSQKTLSGYDWDHAVQTGHHDTPEGAEDWARKHAGKREHEITRSF